MSTSFAGPHGPTGPLLDDDETRVARARRQLTQLGTALVRDPLDRRVHQALRTYMDHDSEAALLSWEAMLQRTPEELRERIRAVITAHAERKAS
ncbi:hypothetical protein [Streptomyces sp. RKAG337]|uniref:hypothetical protein n=1 Tax=Streptomyces sp. RKAG337 TaxID=2893404 RepID=UPI0020333A83|nr:hypothetical protein [Streptomyces sp. RKAG337]MCM2430883.1 hypothetical protein [Streptomyces sp. RKAG337]